MLISPLGRWASLTACAAALFIGTASAGEMHPGSVPGEKATLVPNTSKFSCETRAFDLSQGLFCYTPNTIRKAYGIDGLINKGYTGKGRTIVIIDAYVSPSISSDLALFDTAFGIPAPPSLKIITMPGTPAFDPTDAGMVSWSGEIALDTQWAHAVAPGANIVFIGAKSANDDDLLAALNYALDNHLGDVVSMSFGESESFYGNPDGLDTLAAWTKAFTKAKANQVTLFASAGDWGATNTFDNEGDVLPFQNISWPASSPLVTSVGGTNLFFGSATNADPNGSYQSEQVWNDGFGATGGWHELAGRRAAVPDSLRGALGQQDVAQASRYCRCFLQRRCRRWGDHVLAVWQWRAGGVPLRWYQRGIASVGGHRCGHQSDPGTAGGLSQ